MMRLTKASIESLVDSCVELMAERDKESINAKSELLFEVDTIDDLHTILGYFIECYGSQITTGGDMPLIEKWEFKEGTTTTAQFKMYNDFWVSIGHSDFWNDDLCEILDGCMLVDLRGLQTAEVIE